MARLFATVGEDDPGWFNYTDYEFSAFRNFRASLSTEVRPSTRVQLLAEVRLDHGEYLSAYAFFLRVRPRPERRFDIQVGRVPPTFGAFTRTMYAYDNVMIGQPLAYQYLLTLRTDAVPRTADDLLRASGNGWRTGYPVGNPERGPGLPLFNSNRYDTGVQVHGVTGPRATKSHPHSTLSRCRKLIATTTRASSDTPPICIISNNATGSSDRITAPIRI